MRGGRPAILASLLAAAPAILAADAVPPATIDAYVRGEMARRRIPGLSLLVARSHETVLAASYGLADVEHDAPVTERTTFEIASMTKQFTDAAVLILSERGKLDVGDRLSRFLPDLPPPWEPMTLVQLMNHTAGLRDDWAFGVGFAADGRVASFELEE